MSEYKMRKPRRPVYDMIYEKLMKLGLNTRCHAMKSVSDPYMDLNMDKLVNEKEGVVIISLAHNYVQNGDVMADPDMEIRIDHNMKIAEALTYQNDGLGVRQEVYIYNDEGVRYRYRPKLRKQLNRFLNKWMSECLEQGHHLEKRA